jgi:hypothetical protein
VNVVAAHDTADGRILRGPMDGHKLSKVAAGYSDTGGTDTRSCATCRYHSGGSCRLVEGTILPGGISNLYEDQVKAVPGMQSYYHDLAALEGSAVPIIELAEPIVFKDGDPTNAPEWIPYLPPPGTFKHPKYGSVIITKGRNENFVKQFKAGIYQDRLPIDAEHQTAVSGALGWITDMRVNNDGSVDAKTSWTDRGRVMLANDRLPYFSPAFFNKWVDPTDGKVHSDVAIGGALTTRPFFKPKAGLRAVRPLVTAGEQLYFGSAEFDSPEGPTRFSEFQFAVLEKDEKEDPVTVPAAAPAATTTSPPAASSTTTETASTVTLKDDQVVMSKSDADELKRLRDAAKTPVAAAAVTASEPEIASLRTTVDTQAEALRIASEKIETLNRDGRARRFSDMVEGRSGGKPWVGPSKTHVSMLEMLFSSTDKGEEGDMFKEYVQHQTGIAEQVEKAGLFSDIGSGQARKVVTGSAQEKIDIAVKSYKESHKDIKDDAVAMQAIFSEQPELYNEYIEEHREAGRGQ